MATRRAESVDEVYSVAQQNKTMTTQDKINAIREACISVNPEIVELKFGCKVRFGRWGDSNRIYTVVSRHEDKVFCVRDGKKSVDRITLTDDEIILGRPIRLADVLLAMDERIPIMKTVLYWNLCADDLNLQEEATINVIHNVLCK